MPLSWLMTASPGCNASTGFSPHGVSISVPGELLASKERTLVRPSFIITALRGSASLSGTLVGVTEVDVRSPGSLTVDVTLESQTHHRLRYHDDAVA